ncbi:MAG: hypothetical protein ABIZ91_08880 [Gemmatimonadaceae bacterium]
MLALLAACASGPGGRNAAGRGSRTDVIDRSEIARSNAQNAYDVIRTLRPVFLSSRGPSTLLRTSSTTNAPVVYLDDNRYGDVASLRNIPVDHVFEIRYFSATQAQTRWGMDHPAGAIQIITGLSKRSPPGA